MLPSNLLILWMNISDWLGIIWAGCAGTGIALGNILVLMNIAMIRYLGWVSTGIVLGNIC
jgi:hypothetical protein